MGRYPDPSRPVVLALCSTRVEGDVGFFTGGVVLDRIIPLPGVATGRGIGKGIGKVPAQSL